MDLPFSQAQFFDVFAAYNTAVWPAQIPLAGLGVALVVLVLRAPAKAGRVVAYGLAFLWAWMGLAYHLAFFSVINPAAPAFAAISLAAAAAFAWSGIAGRLVFAPGRSARIVGGLMAITFALVLYPAIGVFVGHRYPAAPSFGLPCPTTIFTFGVLLLASRVPKVLVVGPLLWAMIGSTAAFALGVTQDLGLIAAAAIGVYLLVLSAPPAASLRDFRDR